MAKRFAEQVEADLAEQEQVRAARQHERELAQLKSKLAQSEQKRKQAEVDLERAEGRIDFIRSIGEPDRFDIPAKKLKASGQATAVIVLSDWHVEETVDPDTINGLNEYNLEIASKRITNLFQNSVMLLESERHLSNIQDLVVAILGDIITGFIHDELKETNSLSPVEATEFAMDHIASGIDFLLKNSGCKTITIPCVPGNHGRLTLKNRTGATEYANSIEWLMYRMLAKFYRNQPRVVWKVEKGKHNYLDIQGKLVRFSHGHAFNYNGGVGGCFVPIRRKLAKWNQTRRADWDKFGHLHTHLRDSNWSMNNCLIGYNALALDIGADCTRPSQSLMVFDKKRPLPVTIREIFCD